MIDFPKTPFHTEGEISAQFQRAGWKTRTMETLARTIAELRQGEAGVLDKIELPAGEAQRLMELGFLPGTSVTAAQGSPWGTPAYFASTAPKSRCAARRRIVLSYKPRLLRKLHERLPRQRRGNADRCSRSPCLETRFPAGRGGRWPSEFRKIHAIQPADGLTPEGGQLPRSHRREKAGPRQTVNRRGRLTGGSAGRLRPDSP